MVPVLATEGNPTMTTLSDTQLTILSAAAQRADGNLLPFPGSLRGGAAGKVVGALLARGLIREQVIDSSKADPALNTIWRNHQDGRGVLLLVTSAGLEALGIAANLVLAAAGGGMMGQAFPSTIDRSAAVVAPGMMVMAVILFMGKVSGAHLNSAVSVAFALRGDFPWRRVPGYIIAQLVGATLAALFLHAVINVLSTYGSNYPAAGYSAAERS